MTPHRKLPCQGKNTFQEIAFRIKELSMAWTRFGVWYFLMTIPKGQGGIWGVGLRSHGQSTCRKHMIFAQQQEGRFGWFGFS